MSNAATVCGLNAIMVTSWISRRKESVSVRSSARSRLLQSGRCRHTVRETRDAGDGGCSGGVRGAVGRSERKAVEWHSKMPTENRDTRHCVCQERSRLFLPGAESFSEILAVVWAEDAMVTHEEELTVIVLVCEENWWLR